MTIHCLICDNLKIEERVLIWDLDNLYVNHFADIINISEMRNPYGHAILTVKLVDKPISFVITGDKVKRNRKG